MIVYFIIGIIIAIIISLISMAIGGFLLEWGSKMDCDLIAYLGIALILLPFVVGTIWIFEVLGIIIL